MMSTTEGDLDIEVSHELEDGEVGPLPSENIFLVQCHLMHLTT